MKELFPNISAAAPEQAGFAHERNREGEDKDEWLTPPTLVQALGEFDTDPCSPIVRPWSTAKQHWTERDNGLLKPWRGRVWCNPPYATASAWLGRCAEHGNAIALIFARTDTEAWQRHVFPHASALYFIAGRLRFFHVTGIEGKDTAGAPSTLIAYGKNNADVLRSLLSSQWGGAFVPLDQRSVSSEILL